MKQYRLAAASIAILTIALWSIAVGQVPSQTYMQGKSGSEIRSALHKLGTIGSVMYIAAHPDDENTRLITYLAKHKGYRVSYLSLTRGDGGQNLIGTELGEHLGVIRTQELLAARRIDGGEQYFTRAYDFGFSKTAEETFKHWDREEVLRDVVYAIRVLKPDIIVTRFSPEPMPTHGHHTASAQLALEAFEKSGRNDVFPDQVRLIGTWSPRRIFWNTSSWFFQDKPFDSTKYMMTDIGDYNPVIGASMAEIAALSRSMHRSQGFGSALSRGTTIEYLQQLGGDAVKNDIFEGIQTNWSRLRGGREIDSLITTITAAFNDDKPTAIVSLLLELREKIAFIPENEWKSQKMKELRDLLLMCIGAHFECTVAASEYTRGQELTLRYEALIRQEYPVRLEKIVLPELGASRLSGDVLQENKPLIGEIKAKIDIGAPYSVPFWLEQKQENNFFVIDEVGARIRADNFSYANALFHCVIDTAKFIIGVPITSKKVEPNFGEIREPLTIIPKVSATISQPLTLISGKKSQMMTMVARATGFKGKALIKPIVPEGFTVTPAQAELDFGSLDVLSVDWSVQGSGDAVAFIAFTVEYEGAKEPLHSVEVINYGHIPPQVISRSLEHKVVKADIKTVGKKIAYIQGAGDKVPPMLRQLGYEVEELASLENNLSNRTYKAIVVGIRAFNTRAWTAAELDRLFAFANGGGTVIVQYNTTGSLRNSQFAPYSISLSRDRVTEEDAEVRLLDTKSPLLRVPNIITAADFEGWVQERGLYFPNQWAAEFTPLLSMNDTGETPKDGSLLVAKHGKGTFVYTGLSFFRQLPAGVPGAFRLFANLIAGGSAK